MRRVILQIGPPSDAPILCLQDTEKHCIVWEEDGQTVAYRLIVAPIFAAEAAGWIKWLEGVETSGEAK